MLPDWKIVKCHAQKCFLVTETWVKNVKNECNGNTPQVYIFFVLPLCIKELFIIALFRS